MSRYDAPPNAESQCGRILNLLSSASGDWVPLPSILALRISQYGTRIKELRDEWGIVIENRTETIDGVRHSWFRLVTSPTSHTPEASKAGPDWQSRSRVTGLELFDAAAHQ